MTSHDVTDGCASAGRAPAPCEFCAAFFRLKKIESESFRVQHHALKKYLSLSFQGAAVFVGGP